MKFKMPRKKELITSVLLLIGLTLFYILIAKNNNTIKIWDHSTYWLTTLGQKYSFFNETIITNLRSIYHSINYDDYNLLASVVLMPVFIFTNGNFFSYIMSIYIMGVIPLFIVYIFMYYKIYKKKANWKSLLLFILPLVLTPSLHVPTLEGYLDIIGMIPILIIIYCTYDETFEEFKPKKTIILSICFLLTIILRRYYVYFTVSYFVTLAIIYTIKKLFIKKDGKYIKQGLHLFITGISFSVILVVLFRKMIEHIIQGNYGNAYQAYSMGDIIFQFQDIIKKLGLPLIIIFLVATIYLLLKKKEKREFVIILLVNMFISILLFNRIQTMDQHHYYIFLINVILIISMFLVELYNNKKKNLLVISVICIYSLLNIINSVTHTVQNYLFFSDARITYRSNQREELKETMDYLQDLLKDNDYSVYTVASSGEYNNETFANYYLPKTELRGRIIPTPNVDLRDGFSNSLYYAKYLLVVTPKQLHLKEKDQQVVSIIYDGIENDSPIKDNYNLIKEFKTPSVIIKIYEQIAEYDEGDKEYLKNEFNKSYKEYKDLFEDRIMER